MISTAASFLLLLSIIVIIIVVTFGVEANIVIDTLSEEEISANFDDNNISTTTSTTATPTHPQEHNMTTTHAPSPWDEGEGVFKKPALGGLIGGILSFLGFAFVGLYLKRSRIVNPRR
jgi:hypothetical protein